MLYHRDLRHNPPSCRFGAPRPFSICCLNFLLDRLPFFLSLADPVSKKLHPNTSKGLPESRSADPQRCSLFHRSLMAFGTSP